MVLGTPTYAIPPWMARKYPEVRAERRTGQRIPYGHRQDADYSHPAFRYLAERVVRKVVGRYVDHPSVIGYQVDNEPGMELFHNRGAFHTFVDRLREKYGDVETLNERWGSSTGRTGSAAGTSCGRPTATPRRPTTSRGAASSPR